MKLTIDQQTSRIIREDMHLTGLKVLVLEYIVLYILKPQEES